MWTANARSHVYKSFPLGLSGYLSYRIFETLSSKKGQPWILGCHSVLFFVAHAKLESILQEVSVLILWWIVSCCSNSAVPLIAGFQGRTSGLLARQSQVSGLDSSLVIQKRYVGKGRWSVEYHCCSLGQLLWLRIECWYVCEGTGDPDNIWSPWDLKAVQPTVTRWLKLTQVLANQGGLFLKKFVQTTLSLI